MNNNRMIQKNIINKVLTKMVGEKLKYQECDLSICYWLSDNEACIELLDQTPVIKLETDTDHPNITLLARIRINEAVVFDYDAYLNDDVIIIDEQNDVCFLRLNYGYRVDGFELKDLETDKVLCDMAEVISVSVMEKIDMIKNEIWAMSLEVKAGQRKFQFRT